MSDVTNAMLWSWVANGRPEPNPANRLAYGGVTLNGKQYLKTPSGEVIKFTVAVNEGRVKNDLKEE